MAKLIKEALVLGRQIFVDLWALEGFKKIICEDPSVFPGLMKEVLKENTGLILMEENWFNDLPEIVRQKLNGLQEPVIVIFPSITNHLA